MMYEICTRARLLTVVLCTQDLGMLKGRLRLEHRASKHNGTAYRALYILQPTTELSGEYKCAVSTFHEEDFMIKRMLVYGRLAVRRSIRLLKFLLDSKKDVGCHPVNFDVRSGLRKN